MCTSAEDQVVDVATRIDWERPLARKELLKYAGMLGVGSVGASMLSACAPLAQLAGAPQGAPPPPPLAKYIVIFVVDACRADYLTYTHLPNISALMARGTTYEHAWVGMLESITPACHATIGTGMFPRNDGGIVGFWWENPSTHQELYGAGNIFVDPPGAAAAAGEIAKVIRRSGAPTLAGLLKDVDPTAKVYAGSGQKFYAAAAAGGPDADYLTYFWNHGSVAGKNDPSYGPVCIPGYEIPADILRDPRFQQPDWKFQVFSKPGVQDGMVVELASAVIKRERPRVVILNLPEMDYPVAHLDGGPASPAKVKVIMENADRRLGELVALYRELGILDQTVFAFLGDHGVVPMQQMVDREPIAVAVANAGTSIVSWEYDTGEFVWLEDSTKALKTATFIDDSKMPGVAAVYFLGSTGSGPTYLPSPATASSLHPTMDLVYRYLLSTMAGPAGPHVVVLYPERTGTQGAGGAQNWIGDHGGASWGVQAVPMILAGPGIRNGYRSSFPARLVDLTPTLVRLLGLGYPNLDGVVLADAFRSSQPAERTAQNLLGRQLVPLTTALRRQSALEARELERRKPFKQSQSHSKNKHISGIPNY